MFENINNFFKKLFKIESHKEDNSGKEAKERLHLVLMQDRANVSADFLEMMKQEIIEVIKKYIDVDENQIDVRLTNQENDDGSKGAPALYANIPIVNIKEENQKTPNKVGADGPVRPKETYNEPMSNDVGTNTPGDTDTPEQLETQPTNENTSNNNNSDNIDTSNTQENIQQSNEDMSNDQNDNNTSNQNMQN